MPYLSIDEKTDIYYEEYGSGDRYVFCSQIDHDYTSYSFERELSRRGFHVFLLTNRGYGKSSHTADNFGLGWFDRYADDVVAFADKLGVDKFVYSGASHGSGVGWHLCVNHPDRLICFFALVAGPLDPSRCDIEGVLKGNDVPEDRDITTSTFCTLPPVFFYPTDDAGLIERRKICLDTCMSIRKEPGYEETYESEETLRINFGPAMVKYRTEEKLQEALKTIETPVLMLGGMEDVISRPELMIRTGKCLPHCKLIIHSSFGHMLDIYEDLADDAVRFYENVVNTGRYYTPVDNTPILPVE